MSNSKCQKIFNYELKGVGVGVFPESGKLIFGKMIITALCVL